MKQYSEILAKAFPYFLYDTAESSAKAIGINLAYIYYCDIILFNNQI